MLRSVGSKFCCLGFALAFVPAWAMQNVSLPAAPPAPARALQRVFISNTGDGEGLVLADAPRRTYNRFYAAIKNSGRYELVTLPARADLIFEINYSEPWELVPPRTLYPIGLLQDGPCESQHDYHAYHPQVRLSIWDKKARTSLGAFTEAFDPALFPLSDIAQWRLNEKIDQAVAALMNRTEQLLDRPLVSVALPKNVGEAPVSPQIAAATKIFITNPNADKAHAIEGADQLYSKFLSGMKSWGRFELVSGPASADLVFELSLMEVARTVVETQRRQLSEINGAPLECKTTVTDTRDRKIELTIIAPEGRIVLWGFFQPVEDAFFAGSAKGRLDHATKTLVGNLRRVVERAEATAAQTAGVTSPPAKP